MLAAGRGERLRPLTDDTPKALLTVAGVPLLDRAIARLTPLVHAVAVNAHWLHEQIEAHLAGCDVHVSVEQPEALGTAGALGALREWIAGRDVLVTNCDAWYSEPPPPLTGPGMQLLAVDNGAPADFGNWLYAGTSYLPWSVVETLEPTPSGLYEVCWREAWAGNKLEMVPFTGRFIDCGTPADLEAARAV
ncbi:MAG: NTP transferase domain-containing protein [Actinobacteria bacterium]|nr:NTP transferase domain-containing protein [Actinomycetota bacterium]